MVNTTKEDATEEAPKYNRPVRRADLASLVNENTYLVVQNQLGNIVVFNHKVNGSYEECKFEAKDNPLGEDVMELPSTYLLNADFRKALTKGILKIVEADDQAVVDAFQAQVAAYEEQQRAKAEADRFVDAQQPRALSGKQCLAQEGRGQCSEFAVYANNNDRPPLCQRHAHLKDQFVPEETGTFTNGKSDVNWIRVGILGR